MKWNWGTGIVITFIIFCSLIVAAVVRSFQEDVHLVTEEYYKEELQYQQRIDDVENAKADHESLSFNSEGAQVTIVFNGKGNLSGEIHFYRPDNPGLDKKYTIQQREFVMAKSELSAGRYKVKLSWKDSGKTYYKEETIFI